MKYGAMNFPVLPLNAEIDRIAALGFDYLELAMDPPLAHHASLYAARNDISNALVERNLDLICHLPTFVSIADLTESIRRASLKEMLNSLQTAASLGAAKVVLHPGAIRGMGHFVKEQARAYGLESLDAIHHLAAELALPLCIENMFPGYGAYYEVDEFKTLFDRYPSMRMTLDTGHAHIGADDGKRLRRFVDRYAGRIDHVHISDNNGRADEHLPAGHGSINFPWLVESLRINGFDATVTFEIFTGKPGDLKSSRDRFEKWWHS